TVKLIIIVKEIAVFVRDRKKLGRIYIHISVSSPSSNLLPLCSTMASSNTTTTGVDNTFRKKFDTEEYRERARERENKESDRSKSRCKATSLIWLMKKKLKFLKSMMSLTRVVVAAKGPPVQRAPLKHRDYHVDLESRLGKTQVVTPVAPLSQQVMAVSRFTRKYDLKKTLVVTRAGYFCRVCECVVKDSANYLDHINGKKHQRALGMSMRVERSSLEQVQERFEVLKKRKTPGTFTEQENRNYSLMHSRFRISEFAHDMGIDLDERIRKQQEEEEELKRQRREKKKEKKKGKVMEEEPEMDPEVAEMMGFGGFGSSKKS
ncbi:hypothetical protein EUTSA_v10022198mg, partial [Eutrema salsugineum]